VTAGEWIIVCWLAILTGVLFGFVLLSRGKR